MEVAEQDLQRDGSGRYDDVANVEQQQPVKKNIRVNDCFAEELISKKKKRGEADDGEEVRAEAEEEKQNGCRDDEDKTLEGDKDENIPEKNKVSGGIAIRSDESAYTLPKIEPAMNPAKDIGFANMSQDYNCGKMDYTKHFVAPHDFPSLDAVVTWAKGTATRLGFFLVKASYKTQHDGRRDCYLRCDRHEPKKTRKVDNVVRRNTKRKGTGCKFVIKATERRNRSGWYIAFCSGDSGKHNHELVEHAKAQGLSSGAKQLVRELTEAQLKPSVILAAVKEKFPEDNPSPRHIYNIRRRAMAVIEQDFRSKEYTGKTNVEQQQQQQPLKENKQDNNQASLEESTCDDEELSIKRENKKKRLKRDEVDDGGELQAETEEEEQNGVTDDEYKTLEVDKDKKISKMKKFNSEIEIMNDESTFKLPNFEPAMNAIKGNGFSNMARDYSCDGINYARHFVSAEDFPSLDAAVTWAKETAARFGFFLVIASYKPQRDGRRDCYLRCDRYVSKTTRNLDNAVRLNTKRKGVGCKFLVKAVERKNRSGWYIAFGSGDNSKHNHELVESAEAQNRSLSLGAKQLVRELTEAQMKPSVILAAVKEKFPEDNPSPRHIYNFRIHLRKAVLQGYTERPEPHICCALT